MSLHLDCDNAHISTPSIYFRNYCAAGYADLKYLSLQEGSDDAHILVSSLGTLKVALHASFTTILRVWRLHVALE
jgi:hypothetical protein